MAAEAPWCGLFKSEQEVFYLLKAPEWKRGEDKFKGYYVEDNTADRRLTNVYKGFEAISLNDLIDTEPGNAASLLQHAQRILLEYHTPNVDRCVPSNAFHKKFSQFWEEFDVLVEMHMGAAPHAPRTNDSLCQNFCKQLIDLAQPLEQGAKEHAAFHVKCYLFASAMRVAMHFYRLVFENTDDRRTNMQATFEEFCKNLKGHMPATWQARKKYMSTVLRVANMCSVKHTLDVIDNNCATLVNDLPNVCQVRANQRIKLMSVLNADSQTLHMCHESHLFGLQRFPLQKPNVAFVNKNTFVALDDIEVNTPLVLYRSNNAYYGSDPRRLRHLVAALLRKPQTDKHVQERAAELSQLVFGYALSDNSRSFRQACKWRVPLCRQVADLGKPFVDPDAETSKKRKKKETMSEAEIDRSAYVAMLQTASQLLFSFSNHYGRMFVTPVDKTNVAEEYSLHPRYGAAHARCLRVVYELLLRPDLIREYTFEQVRAYFNDADHYKALVQQPIKTTQYDEICKLPLTSARITNVFCFGTEQQRVNTNLDGVNLLFGMAIRKEHVKDRWFKQLMVFFSSVLCALTLDVVQPSNSPNALTTAVFPVHDGEHAWDACVLTVLTDNTAMSSRHVYTRNKAAELPKLEMPGMIEPEISFIFGQPTERYTYMLYHACECPYNELLKNSCVCSGISECVSYYIGPGQTSNVRELWKSVACSIPGHKDDYGVTGRRDIFTKRHFCSTQLQKLYTWLTGSTGLPPINQTVFLFKYLQWARIGGAFVGDAETRLSTTAFRVGRLEAAQIVHTAPTADAVKRIGVLGVANAQNRETYTWHAVVQGFDAPAFNIEPVIKHVRAAQRCTAQMEQLCTSVKLYQNAALVPLADVTHLFVFESYLNAADKTVDVTDNLRQKMLAYAVFALSRGKACQNLPHLPKNMDICLLNSRGELAKCYETDKAWDTMLANSTTRAHYAYSIDRDLATNTQTDALLQNLLANGLHATQLKDQNTSSNERWFAACVAKLLQQDAVRRNVQTIQDHVFRLQETLMESTLTNVDAFEVVTNAVRDAESGVYEANCVYCTAGLLHAMSVELQATYATVVISLQQTVRQRENAILFFESMLKLHVVDWQTSGAVWIDKQSAIMLNQSRNKNYEKEEATAYVKRFTPHFLTQTSSKILIVPNRTMPTNFIGKHEHTLKSYAEDDLLSVLFNYEQRIIESDGRFAPRRPFVVTVDDSINLRLDLVSQQLTAANAKQMQTYLQLLCAESPTIAPYALIARVFGVVVAPKDQKSICYSDLCSFPHAANNNFARVAHNGPCYLLDLCIYYGCLVYTLLQNWQTFSTKDIEKTVPLTMETATNSISSYVNNKRYMFGSFSQWFVRNVETTPNFVFNGVRWANTQPLVTKSRVIAEFLASCCKNVEEVVSAFDMVAKTVSELVSNLEGTRFTTDKIYAFNSSRNPSNFVGTTFTAMTGTNKNTFQILCGERFNIYVTPESRMLHKRVFLVLVDPKTVKSTKR